MQIRLSKNFNALYLGIAMFAAVSQSASAAEVTWTLAHTQVPGSMTQTAAEEIPERIAKATDGRVEIVVNTSLVPPNRHLEGIRDGIVDMSILLEGYYSSTLPVVGLVYLPFVANTNAEYRQLRESEIGQEIARTYDDEYDAKILMHGVVCPQTLVSTKPVTTKDDWSGLDVRVGSKPMGVLMTQLGANAVSLATGDVQPGLQRGIIDGVLTDGCWAQGAGFFSGGLVSDAADWKLGLLGYPVIISNSAFDALPDDLKPVVEAEFKAIENDLYEEIEERLVDLRQRIEKDGGTPHEIAPEEIIAIRDGSIVEAIDEDWAAGASDAGLDADKWLGIARSISQ